MRHRKTIYLAILLAAGTAVWLFTTPRQPGAQPEPRVTSQRRSKAFQYIVDAGRNRSETPRDVTGTGTTARSKAESKRETIDRFRDIGRELFSRQRDYLASIEDRAARNEAEIVSITGNKLMLAAVLAEMSNSREYSEQLTDMLQDEGLRWYVVHGLSQYFPSLSQHIEQGGKIDAGNVVSLFSSDRDFLSEFDARVASNVSAVEAAAFETGVANFIAAEVLTWQAVHSGEMDRSSQPRPFWDSLYREMNP